MTKLLLPPADEAPTQPSQPGRRSKAKPKEGLEALRDLAWEDRQRLHRWGFIGEHEMMRGVNAARGGGEGGGEGGEGGEGEGAMRRLNRWASLQSTP